MGAYEGTTALDTVARCALCREEIVSVQLRINGGAYHPRCYERLVSGDRPLSEEERARAALTTKIADMAKWATQADQPVEEILERVEWLGTFARNLGRTEACPAMPGLEEEEDAEERWWVPGVAHAAGALVIGLCAVVTLFLAIVGAWNLWGQ